MAKTRLQSSTKKDRAYWLLKSEPGSFSIDDLQNAKKQTTPWDGVRNYQARNYLKNEMKVGDLAFFYHSSCAIPGIVGIVEIIHEGYPDPSAFSAKSPYYDPKSCQENPRWYMVDVQLREKFSEIIPLSLLKKNSQLRNMILNRPGNRLSVMPITHKEWETILKMTSSKGIL